MGKPYSWIKVDELKPIDNVDVHVKLESGITTVARYWSITSSWLCGNPAVSRFDTVIKWRYEDAPINY